MKTQKTILYATLVLLFVLAGSASAYYNVKDLGTLPSGSSSYAYSINDNGQIVGQAYDSTGWSHAILFGGTNKDLGGLGGPGSVAHSNNNGQIVGGAHIADGFTSRACLFDSTGGGANINLGILPGYEQSDAYSVNNSCQIVGHSENYGPYYFHQSHACIFYATGGSPTDLGTLSGYNYSESYSINDNAQIVGASWHDYNPSLNTYDSHACLFDWTGGWNNIDLGTLPGYQFSCAYSINNDGQIVGGATNSSGYYHACLFDQTGGGANIDLGTVVGFNNTWASFINDHDQIVGSASNSAYDSHACLLDSTGQGNNIDLNTLIDPSSGWTLTNAYGINNNGWIVGGGVNPNGHFDAFLLTPEPASVVMMGLGGLALLRKRRA